MQELWPAKSVTPFPLCGASWPPLRLSMRQADCGSLDSLQNSQQTLAEQNQFTDTQADQLCLSGNLGIARQTYNANRQTVYTTLNHPRFRAAYDFLLLREAAGEALGDSGEWWTVYQFGDDIQKQELIEGLPKPEEGADAATPHRKQSMSSGLQDLKQAPRFIAVEGPIGVGKTSLTSAWLKPSTMNSCSKMLKKIRFSIASIRIQDSMPWPGVVFPIQSGAQKIAESRQSDLFEPVRVSDSLLTRTGCLQN